MNGLTNNLNAQTRVSTKALDSTACRTRAQTLDTDKCMHGTVQETLSHLGFLSKHGYIR